MWRILGNARDPGLEEPGLEKATHQQRRLPGGVCAHMAVSKPFQFRWGPGQRLLDPLAKMHRFLPWSSASGMKQLQGGIQRLKCCMAKGNNYDWMSTGPTLPWLSLNAPKIMTTARSSTTSAATTMTPIVHCLDDEPSLACT